MAGGRISRTIIGCANYIDSTDDFLQEIIVPANPARLGLTPQNATDWHTWRINNDKLIVLRKSKVTKSPDLNSQVKVSKKGFIKFAQPLLDIIAASPNATTTDANIFNVVLVRKTPTHSDTPIKDTCTATLQMLGGGKMSVKCRTATGGKRPKLAAGADGVETSYVIGDKNTKVPDPDLGTTQKSFSKASFIMSLGAVNSGAILYIYVRWINTKNDKVASGWSLLQIIPIV